MVKVAPSILSADFCRLGEEIDAVSSADWLHLDVMDGIFVPNISIGVPVIESVRKYTSMFLDAHLMISRMDRVAMFADTGVNLITVHVEAASEAVIRDTLKELERAGVKRGLALRPETPVECVVPFLENGLVDLVLIMTVSPGFGGQSFLADQLPKIKAVRSCIDRYCPGCELEVDGGIHSETGRMCVQAGASVLVAGSSIYRAPDRKAAIAALRR